MNEKEVLDNLRTKLIKVLNNLITRSLNSKFKEDGTNIENSIKQKQGNGFEEKTTAMIKSLKEPSYTKDKLIELEKMGYNIDFKDNKFYIIYNGSEEEIEIEMPKDIQELFEQLDLFDGFNKEENNSISRDELIEKIEVNILKNSYFKKGLVEIGKDALQEKGNKTDVPDYRIGMDSNGAISVDVNKKRYYFPIRLSKMILSSGVLKDEQALMRYINDTFYSIMKASSRKKNNKKLDEYYKLFDILKDENEGKSHNITYIDGRYYLKNNENNTIVEFSLELNNFIVELEKNIFKSIRKSMPKEKCDYISDLDLRSYYSLQKMCDLGFAFEIKKEDKNENEENIVDDSIIVTSPTGRKFLLDIGEIPDLDFAELPFTKEGKRSNKYILNKENIEKEVELIKDVNSKIVALKRELSEKDNKSYFDIKELKTQFIRDVFLNDDYKIVRKNSMYYIEKDLFNIQLTDKQSEFLSDLEEELFETIYSSEKEDDVNAYKSKVLDVNGCNTIIQMIKLGYKFQMVEDKEHNNEIVIKSPTGREIKKSISDLGNVDMNEIFLKNKVHKKSKTIVLEELEKYTELSKYINQIIIDNFNPAEKNLDNIKMDAFTKNLSMKYLLEKLKPNDRNMLIEYRENENYIIWGANKDFSIELSEELSSRINKLFEKYVDVLYEDNAKIIFNENKEAIGIDYNSQKTIIELWEKGYSFNVKDNNIEITSPLGRKFEVSAESFNKRGLPYSKTTFKQIKEFERAERDTQNYDTQNYYEFLMSKLKYDVEYVINLMQNDSKKNEELKVASRYTASVYNNLKECQDKNTAYIRDEDKWNFDALLEEKLKELKEKEKLETDNTLDIGVDRND